MGGAVRIAVYLDASAYERIKEIAQTEDRAPAELVREAVAEYAERRRPRRAPKSVGIGHSRKGDVSTRAEELLEGMGHTK